MKLGIGQLIQFLGFGKDGALTFVFANYALEEVSLQCLKRLGDGSIVGNEVAVVARQANE